MSEAKDLIDDSAEKIRIRFKLALGVNDPSIEVSSEPIAVPSTIRRRGLSAVINHLLDRKIVSKEDEEEGSDEDSNDDKLPSISFDFLINKKLLRTCLQSGIRREGLSLEEAIEIQYFPALNAPSGDGASNPLPDWISAMSHTLNVGGHDALCLGGYDGTIRVFSTGNDCREIASIHSQGPIKCIASSPSISMSPELVIATGSIDQTLVSHKFSVNDAGKEELVLHAVYNGGHFNSVESVDLHKTSNNDLHMASGDWDGGLSLWKVPNQAEENIENEGDTNTKKIRTDFSSSSKSKSAVGVIDVRPIHSWKAHASSVSGIIWGEGETSPNLITSSWDHSIKVWDSERQDCLLTLNGSRVISAMGKCSNSDVVATGHPDCTIRLWDMRVGENVSSKAVSESAFKPSHKAWVSAVQWSPTEPHVLATNSHDGCVKLWDIRSSLPLHTIRAHDKGEKGLCLALTKKAIFSGGSDCTLKRYVT